MQEKRGVLMIRWNFHMITPWSKIPIEGMLQIMYREVLDKQWVRTSCCTFLTLR